MFNSGKAIKSLTIRRRFFDNVVFKTKFGANKLRRNSRIVELKINSARQYLFSNHKLYAFKHFVKFFASRGMSRFFKRNPGSTSATSNLVSRETLFRTRRRVRFNTGMRKLNSSRALMKNSRSRKLTTPVLLFDRRVRAVKTKSISPITKAFSYTLRRRSFF